MISIITKKEKVGKIKEILNDFHGIETPYGWEMGFCILLMGCEDHIEVHGYGSKAHFVQK